MIIIDQPAIILMSIDNECTIISLVWSRNIYRCHCIIYLHEGHQYEWIEMHQQSYKHLTHLT